MSLISLVIFDFLLKSGRPLELRSCFMEFFVHSGNIPEIFENFIFPENRRVFMDFSPL